MGGFYMPTVILTEAAFEVRDMLKITTCLMVI